MQYLRAFAAILVVYCHVIDSVFDSLQGIFYNNFGGYWLLESIFLWGIPSAMFFFGLIFFEKSNKSKFIKSKILFVLGDVSYSIF